MVDMAEIVQKSKEAKEILFSQFPESVDRIDLMLGDEGFFLRVTINKGETMPLDSINGFRILKWLIP